VSIAKNAKSAELARSITGGSALDVFTVEDRPSSIPGAYCTD
jgi:hypothetical protein